MGRFLRYVVTVKVRNAGPLSWLDGGENRAFSEKAIDQGDVYLNSLKVLSCRCFIICKLKIVSLSKRYNYL